MQYHDYILEQEIAEGRDLMGLETATPSPEELFMALEDGVEEIDIPDDVRDAFLAKRGLLL